MKEREYVQENSKVCLGLLDSKAESSNATYTNSSQSQTNTKSSKMGRSFFLYSLRGKSRVVGNAPIIFT